MLMASIPVASALDTEGSYFLDSDSVSVVISDQNGSFIVDDLFVFSEKTYEITNDAISHSFIHDSGNFGRILGKTSDGETVYLIYMIDDNGVDVTLKAKIWTDDGVKRIITSGQVFPLF